MSLLLRLLALAAALAAASLIALEITPLWDIFLRADPTLQGPFSMLHARAFLSIAGHLALVMLSLHGVHTFQRRYIRQPTFGRDRSGRQ